MGLHCKILVQKEESTTNLGENLRDIILLDSDSNTIIFCKKELVDKVFDSNNSMKVRTNRDGTLKLNKKCTIRLFKKKY